MHFVPTNQSCDLTNSYERDFRRMNYVAFHGFLRYSVRLDSDSCIELWEYGWQTGFYDLLYVNLIFSLVEVTLNYEITELFILHYKRPSSRLDDQFFNISFDAM